MKTIPGDVWDMKVTMSDTILPAEVAALASRLGADGKPDRVHLTQYGTMTEGPGKPWMRFSATDTIELATTAFDWRARTGPLSCLTIVDQLSQRSARSELRLFGIFPLARSPFDEAALRKGQVIRYLAEIPWAPDVIVRNTSLQWTVRTRGVSVHQSSPFGRFNVDLDLDAEGRIGGVSAMDRPRLEDGRFVERAWRGRFSDYRLHCSRWIPFKGEVSWAIDGGFTTVWRADLAAWQLT
ncbi:DUF6544 family protein [Bradyrhizobium sp. RDI18]|uniref:DUF6544 family protein n=1 Tax=Bradyrhizobium sp. RDI18 TaxID=3367400 RepID=UPI003719B889